MNKSRYCDVLQAFIALSFGPALAIAEPATSRAPERITIVGTPDQIDAIPGSAQALESFELDRHSHDDIHRILRQIPGVNVLEEDGFGLFPNIGIRGTRLDRNSRITVMEDGVLIAPAPYTAPAAYYFPPVARMSRVEVRKGSAAIKAGPNTTGGALNLLSTPIPEKASGHAGLLFGSYNGRRNHAWAGGAEGQFAWLLEANTSQSSGFKQLDSNLRTGHNMPVPNTGFDRQNYLAKLRWNTSESPIYQELELKLSADELTAHETYLGLSLEDYKKNPLRRYSGSQLDQLNTNHELIQLRHHIQPTANLDLTTTLYRMDLIRNWYKLQGVQNEAGGRYVGISGILANPGNNTNAMAWIRGEASPDILGNVRANNRSYYSQGLQTQIDYSYKTGGISHELEIGLRYHEDEEDRLQWQDSFRIVNGTMVAVQRENLLGAEDRVEIGIPGSTDNRVMDSQATSLYIENAMNFGDWLIVPGLRYEDITSTRKDYFQGDDPRRDEVRNKQANKTQVFLPGLGTTYTLQPGLILLAGIHQGFAPTGSDETVPVEKSWNYEAGVRYQAGLFRSELISFFNQYENLVGTCTAASGGGCEIGDQFDGGKVDVQGLEALAAYDLGKGQGWDLGVPLKLSYSWTQSKFKSSFSSSFAEWGEVSSGDELPQIPGHQLNLGLGLTGDGWAVHMNANYVSETRAVAGSGSITEDERMDSRTVIDISGEYRIHENGRLFASVENLTDETYVIAHRPAGLRPGAPRMSWMGVKLDF